MNRLSTSSAKANSKSGSTFKSDQWLLSELAAAVSGSLIGEDIAVNAVGIDSRVLVGGEVFIALQGPTFDGHDYARQAQEKGAVALLLNRALDDINLPQVIVDDTRQALGEMAAAWRQRYSVQLVAVTGSNGKTTVKEMIAAILAVQGDQVLVTRGNFNNDIGMPLTLMELRAAHRYAVIEMGANHPDDIAYLADVAKPDVALITNAAAAHLAGFGSLDGVARAKGEIYAALNESGTAIINADDDYADLWSTLAGHCQRQYFSVQVNQRQADFYAEDIAVVEGGVCAFTLHSAGDAAPLQLNVPGQHNVSNALAAAAAAHALGVDMAQICSGLESVQAVSGRLQFRSARDNDAVTIIDDTYNANPASARAALDVLESCLGARVLVLGDMGELGDDAMPLHAEIGVLARNMGIEHLLTVGGYAAAASQAFGENGCGYVDQQALLIAVKSIVNGHQGKMTILIKGSRSMHMEDVVAQLVDETYDRQAVKCSQSAATGGVTSPGKRCMAGG